MAGKQLVVIGASAGGIEALRVLVAALPDDFPTPICIVMHTSPQSPGVLHEILTRAGTLRAVSPQTGEPLRPGRIYVAPPDQHLLVEPRRVRVTKGPKENRFRPAIDPLFRSAAQVYGPGAIGVILTGNLDDGTAGLWAIKQLGGVAIVQDPSEAMFPSMPRSACEYVQVDHVVPLAQIAPLLVRITSVPAKELEVPEVPELMDIEVNIAKEQNAHDAGIARVGEPSPYACPECHGVLLQVNEANRLRFRCHTGHAYSAESLLADISEGIENSLWNAIRSLEEGGLLMKNLAEHLRTVHQAEGAERLLQRAREAKKQSDLIRELVMAREPLPAEKA
jgi:two-component system chemotaxis response regulator CheB